MYALVCLILLVAADGGQDTNDAKALLQKAESLRAQRTHLASGDVEPPSYRAMDGPAIPVRVKIAVQAPFKMRRETMNDQLYGL